MVKNLEYPALFIKERYEVIKKLPTDRDRRMARAIRRALENKKWKQVLFFLSHPRLALLLAQTGEEGNLVKIVFVGSKISLFSFPKVPNRIRKGKYRAKETFSREQKTRKIL